MNAWHSVRSNFKDPRLFQITSLSLLILYGMLVLDFDLSWFRIALTLSAVLTVQWICTRAYKVPRFDPKSPLISGLSLCLLLRTNQVEWLLLAAAITIASKFMIRRKGKHVFNPTNFGIAVLLLATDSVWIAHGQWGTAAWLGFFLVCMGGLVVNRAHRSDITWAFLASYCLLLFGRSIWLGDPLEIPLHRIQNGAFLLFTFFMISDPKTCPDRRLGRVTFAFLVAVGAMVGSFVLFEPNGLLYALIFSAPLVPVIDWILPGSRYTWGESRSPQKGRALSWLRLPIRSFSMRRATMLFLAGLFLLQGSQFAHAFCGFYVAKADADLFNEASQVVLVRHDNKTVITMANDYQGAADEFAMVVPVPTFIEEGQINVANMALIDHLDAYTSPRLVEYYDENPCLRYRRELAMKSAPALNGTSVAEQEAGADRDDRVTIEATYTVGEYDILILSAKESDGLESWLIDNGYKIPEGATRVLGSYIKQGMRFFVAKVNLEEQSKLGYTMLRPLQVAFESPKFMLPIRLGTVNAKGPQDLIVYTLTQTGRVETTNYRTINLPSNVDIPTFVGGEFGDFYKALFSQQVEKEGMRTVFTEYAWNMAWCDPCAANPLSQSELQELGVFWLGDASAKRGRQPQAQNVYVTRLHVRYDGKHFPDDLVFQETGDTSNFQGRYVMRHPWTGNETCDAAQQYRKQLRERQENEAVMLARLTGWDLNEIRSKIGFAGEPEKSGNWWDKLWGKN